MSKTVAETPHHTASNNTTSINPAHYLMWFRRDLRVHDNTALAALCERANENNALVSAIFFMTPEQWHAHDMSLTQLDHIARTLPILAKNLHQQLNITLNVQVCARFSDCVESLDALCAANNISTIMANHEYEGNEIDRDKQLTKQLAKNNIAFVRWHDQCILPPQSITTNDGDSMYQVFTPFYKKWRHTLDVSSMQMHEAAAIHHNNANIESSKQTVNTIEALSQKVVKDYQQLLANNAQLSHIDSKAQLDHARTAYPAGEDAACQRLKEFIADDIDNYDISRDVPSLQATSQLSAYLTIGAISPRLCYLQASEAAEKRHGNDRDTLNNSDNNDINHWISELAWRDFYRHVLVDKPALIRHKAYKEETDSKINWSYDNDDFHAWCTGMTGVPLVDAAMRCLNTTGFMHNRLRMVTAMFLSKDLLLDWRLGERYFIQQLIDGDFASNNGGWQWSASTGTDSAPYFRIMNPFSQAKTHDSDGEFIKAWLPELKEVPASILHSEDKMRQALTKGGKFADIDYPVPMVEHKAARQLVIAEFKR
ncbi:cryptochrome/photolyase family protein [Psychrobacter sp. ANT_WB68]|uniref:cryptochrome/photolyase family protein n=1 Tax=Psychrobacter sp. ANT_WB68 TaxID=2597355 RepID=UPI0011F3F755|nr:FAD-binding domain-containing protein [Psychrobacter sp. ANT_WB68]KAA0912825.1 deoxyribodipyrimidine photo-lyase [Psychrobacter sp. ANT_WB68]